MLYSLAGVLLLSTMAALAPSAFGASGEGKIAPPLHSVFGDADSEAAPDPLVNPLVNPLVDPFQDRFGTTSGWGSAGSPFTLTWSLAPDGLLIQGGAGEPNSPNTLFASLDLVIARATWIARIQSCFDRWQAVSGVTFQRVSAPGVEWDDGAAWGSASGPTRGHIRIAMHPIDGADGVLAYGLLPGSSEIILDQASILTFASAASNHLAFRTVISREIGTAIGLHQVCPSNGTKLMEGQVSSAFDGPQHDDIRAAQHAYGDINEPDDSLATGVDSGPLFVGQSRTLGTIQAPGVANSSTLSLDSSFDVDWHLFSTSQIMLADFRLSPVGLSYLSAGINANGSCPTGTLINSKAAADLKLELRTGLNTLITSTNSTGAGEDETLTGVLLSPGGTSTFALKVSGQSFNAAVGPQMYTLTLTGTNPCVAFGTTSGIGRVTLSWTNIPGNAGYTIKRNSVNSASGAVVVGTATTNTTVDTTAPASQTQYYFIYANQFGADRLVASVMGRNYCPGDLNLDGQVDDGDFVLFAGAYNLLLCSDHAMPSGCPADFNNDDLVDDADFVTFASAYDQLVCD